MKEILLWGVGLEREDGVATRIAWGERGANDGRTGLVSGLWYPLHVIDGDQRENRRGKEGGGGGQEVLPLPVHVFYFIVSRK